MLRKKFVKLVCEVVDESYEKGIKMFMENLDRDLAKEEFFETYKTEQVLLALFDGTSIGTKAKKALMEQEAKKSAKKQETIQEDEEVLSSLRKEGSV